MDKSPAVRKRFIAGAVCPKCGETDKIYVLDYVLEKSGRHSRHCSRCDFEEDMPVMDIGPTPEVRVIVRHREPE